MSFLLNNCTLFSLTKDISSKCLPFDCGKGKNQQDLNEFFAKDHSLYYDELLGKSYCFTLNENPNIIVCAFTIANDSIKTNVIPNASKKRVNKKIPHVKKMRSYPAVLIGRLGISKDYARKKIGTELMNFIKSWFVDGKNKTGCRFIVVDSYNEQIPLAYYTSNGFVYLFNEIDEEKEYYKTPKEENLKTRLMYFDLIVLNVKT